MNAGPMNRRLRLLRPSAIDDGFSRSEGAPVELGTVWARKTDVRDSERMTAEQNGSALTTRFVVRSSPLTRSIRNTDQVECEALLYEVVGIKDADDRGAGVEITAAAVRT